MKFIIQPTKRLLDGFSSSPSLRLALGLVLLPNSHLFCCRLGRLHCSSIVPWSSVQLPWARCSFPEPPQAGGCRRLQALADLRPGACWGSYQHPRPAEASRHVNHVGRCETVWIPQTSTGKKNTHNERDSANILYYALPSANAESLLITSRCNNALQIWF